MARDTSVTLRMSAELKKALQEYAENDRRTLSSYIEVVLERHVDALLQAEGSHSRRMEIGQAQRGSIQGSKRKK